MSVIVWLYIAVASSAGFGLIALQHLWRGKIETQYQLDRCTSQTAETLTLILNQIDSSGLRQKGYRMALNAFSKTPLAPAAQTLRALIVGENLYQRARALEWTFVQARWNTTTLCNKGAFGKPLARHGYHWPLPDSLGPKPPERKPPLGLTHSSEQEITKYELFLIRNSRTSRVQIFKRESKDFIFSKKWGLRYGSKRPSDA